MTDSIILTIPEEISARARQIAENQAKSAEQVLIDYLKTFPPSLPPDIQAELDALRHLSDDALMTIAHEQMPNDAQQRANDLLDRNSRDLITNDEHLELEKLVERADRLMLRKAEAVNILRQRGSKPGNE